MTPLRPSFTFPFPGQFWWGGGKKFDGSPEGGLRVGVRFDGGDAGSMDLGCVQSGCSDIVGLAA